MAALCEDHHEIDLARLRHLKPGRSSSITWSRGGRPTGSIRIEAGRHCMRLAYRYWQPGGTWREEQEVLTFTETATCFGGRRRQALCAYLVLSRKKSSNVWVAFNAAGNSCPPSTML